MQRGEIWWAHLGREAKTRPVLLLSRDSAYAGRTHITIAPITSRNRRLRSEVRLTRADGLREISVVSLDNIQTIARGFVLDRIAQLSDERMREVAEAIRYAIALPEYR